MIVFFLYVFIKFNSANILSLQTFPLSLWKGRFKNLHTIIISETTKEEMQVFGNKTSLRFTLGATNGLAKNAVDYLVFIEMKAFFNLFV